MTTSAASLEENSTQGLVKRKKSPKILVVEDDITCEPIWEYIIRSVNSRAIFHWATSEKEAETMIHLAAQNKRGYDLVIADIFLSGSRTGLDLWHRFQELLGDRLLLISSIDHEKLFRYLGPGQGSPTFIQKPLNPEACIEIISGMLNFNQN